MKMEEADEWRRKSLHWRRMMESLSPETEDGCHQKMDEPETEGGECGSHHESPPVTTNAVSTIAEKRRRGGK